MAGSKTQTKTSAQSTIFGVPARFMRPRLLLLLACFVLCAFGALMVFSASSITALQETGDPSYYLVRQLVAIAIGLVLAAILAHLDYHVFSGTPLLLVWLLCTGLLLATAAIGVATKGATRWIRLGSAMTIQPSEFAKVGLVLVAAWICQKYFEDESISFNQALALAAVGLGVPLVLIVIQPDKGTTIILAATLLVMLYLSGLSLRILGPIVVGVVIVALVLSLGDEYSRKRIMTMFNPKADPYDAGYQLLQGFYAFANGGLTGVGIGLSRQKYAYLPEAHNDFIFAIIGEETGFLGALLVIALFVLLVWAAFQIGKYAPDLSGRLIACGASSLLIIQMLVNIGGVLGLLPLTGKPLPFLSYGGSSVMSSLMLIGLIVSVSRHSQLPETIHDRSRAGLKAQAGSLSDIAQTSTHPSFTLVEGGAATNDTRAGSNRSSRGSSSSSRSGSSRSVPLTRPSSRRDKR